MDAVALPIVAGPTPMPTPNSEMSLSEVCTSFGVLVAAVAKGEHPQAAGPAEAPQDSSTTAPEAASDLPPAFVARQWLVQTESPPSLSKGLLSVLEGFPGNTPHSARPESPAPTDSEPENSLPSDGTDGPTLPFEAPAPSAANQEAVESNRHARKTERTGIPVLSQDRSKPHPAEPSEALTPAIPAPPSENAKPFIQPQATSTIGWSALNEQPRSIDGNAPKVSETAPFTRPQPTALAVPTIESPVAQWFDSQRAPTGDSPKSPVKDAASEANAAAPHQPKTAQPVDSPKPSEPNTVPSTRAPEPLPQFAAHQQAAPQANTSTQTPDSVGVTLSTTNSPAVADTNAEQPVKLALATRTGQQTPEMQSLALHIAARSARGDSRFTIRLDPPELGRIDVNLSVSSHGHAQAVLAVEKPQTLELLLRDAPALERALKDAGLELGSNLSFSLKEEGRSQFARDDQDTRPSRPVQLVQAEAANIRSPLHSSAMEHLYGLRIARLDITV
jgi:flagellar hook-length control protein FliK